MKRKTISILAISILLTLTITSLASASYYYVSIENLAFSPSTLTINQGDTVMWTNYDLVQHTITSDSGYDLYSSPINQANVYSYTFDYYGTYSYHCSIHPNMHGQIIVNPNGNNYYSNNYNSNSDNIFTSQYDYSNYYKYAYKSAYDYSSIANNANYNKNYQTRNADYQKQEYVKVYYYVYYHTPNDYALAYKYVPKKTIYDDEDNKHYYEDKKEDYDDFHVYTYTYPKNINYPGYGQPKQYTSSNNNYQITNNYLGVGYYEKEEPPQIITDRTSEHLFKGDQNSRFQGN